ncbi:hypothetical protein B0H14DRAFT_2636821 [Mycena olivaceomarginata]|nr:hypothetical protein B0H14DRAFT_2636821 [Mycena olivaceomarginata]
MGLRQSNEFFAVFALVDAHIADFRCKTASMDPTSYPTTVRRTFLTGCRAIQAIVLQLHGIFAQTSIEAKDKCVAAAIAILQLLIDNDMRGTTSFAPFFPYAATCEVAIDQIGGLWAERLACGLATGPESALVETSTPPSMLCAESLLSTIEKAYGAGVSGSI